MDIDTNFIFQPIGFGLFYSGSIGDFNFIYDCGSKSKKTVNKIIRNDFKNKKIGLLAISHFHSDHISGLEELIKETKSIDKIILPFITTTEKLNYLLSYGKTPPKWYIDFIIDPVTKINKWAAKYHKEIKEIILITGGNSENNHKVDENNIKPFEPSKEYKYELDLSNLDEVEEIDDKEFEGINLEDNAKLLKSGNIKLLVNKNIIWIFSFSYSKFNRKQINYLRKIKKLLSISSYSTIKPANLRKLFSMYGNGKNILASINRTIPGNDINDTSLILLHYPVIRNNY